MKTIKVVIKDSKTNEYYCVPMTAIHSSGEPMAGDNDFPYWSLDEVEAYDFKDELSASNEFKFNDLTCDGERVPNIIFLKS